MKLLFDFLPVILFFATYHVAGSNMVAAHDLISPWLGDGILFTQVPILIATAVTIVVTGIQVAWMWMRHGKVHTTLWVSFALILVFGGATLAFHDPVFVKWKPTVLYWAFAIVLGVSASVFRANLLRRMLGSQVRFPDQVWARLNGAWIGFFILMGGLNLYVAFGFSEETWVNYRMFGGTALTLAFMLAQGFYLSRHLEEETN